MSDTQSTPTAADLTTADVREACYQRLPGEGGDERFDRWLAARDARVRESVRAEMSGPHPCCQHCAEDVIHDVEKDQHALPCTLCTTKRDAQVAAKTLRDAAARARDARATRGLWGRVQVDGRPGIAGWLDNEADQIAKGGARD